MRLDVLKFALAAGMIGAISVGLMTVAALTSIPGYLPVAKFVEQAYGSYGYSISWLGIFVGALYGFIEGFVWFGIFAWIYNRLVK